MVRCPGIHLLSISGEFDAFSGHLLRRIVDDSPHGHQPQVVFDLSNVTFMDAGALGTIAYCRRMLVARSTELSLVCPDGQPLRLLRLLGLDRVWPVHPTREDALRRQSSDDASRRTMNRTSA